MIRFKGKAKFVLLLIAVLLIQTGCWGVREPDQLGFILAMGIDKGQSNIISVTFQVAIPKAIGGPEGGGGGEATTEVITLEAASIFGALQLANAFVSRDLTLIHNDMIVVSEEIAREGLEKYINPLIRSRDIRRNAVITITKEGKAADFIKINKPILELNPARQYELLLQAKGFTGFIHNTVLNDFSAAAKSPGRNPVLTLVGINEGKKEQVSKDRSVEEKVRDEVAYLPGEIPREGGNKIDLMGLAVFRGDKLAGYLNGAETRYFLMAIGEFQSAIFTFPDPRKPGEDIVVVRILQGRSPEIRVNLTGDSPRIDVGLVLEGEILSIQSGINYERGELHQELTRYIEEYINRELSKVITKSREEFQSDIFGFGENTRQYFWTWGDWEKYRWLEKYPRAQVNVRTQLEIRRSGLMIQTAPQHTGEVD